MFNEPKAAQAAAFFLLKTQSGVMPHLKLMKLLYLAERESMRLHGFPMVWDYPVSMPHGPVLSKTLNLMDGDEPSSAEGWESWISAKENNALSLKRPGLITADFDELSVADVEVLESIWTQFGDMGKWEIRDYTHEHCAEWRDPQGSSHPISIKRIFEAVGFDSNISERLEQRVLERKKANEALALL